MKWLSRILRAHARFGHRRYRALLAVAFAYTLTAPLWVSGIRVEIDSSRVVPADDPVARAFRVDRELFGETSPLVVEIRPATGRELAAYDGLTERLAAELSSWPDISGVFYRPFDVDRRAILRRLPAALLNPSPPRVEEMIELFTPENLRRRLLRTRRNIVALGRPAERERLAADPLGISAFVAEYEQSRLPDLQIGESGYLDAPDGRSRLMLVQPSVSSEDSVYCSELLERVGATIAALWTDASEDGGSAVGAGAPRVRFAGIYAIRAETTELGRADLSRITLLAGSLLLGLVWASFGRMRIAVACLYPLVVSLLAVLLLVRFAFNPVDAATIGFAAIFMGIGLDAVLHLMARYWQLGVDESQEEALAETFADAGPPIVVGLVTTATAFVALTLSDNGMLRQFGILTAVGLLVTLVVTLLLFPALTRWLRLDSGKGRGQDTMRGAAASRTALGVWWIPGSFFASLVRRPRASIGIALCLVVASLPLAREFRLDRSLEPFFPGPLPSLTTGSEIGRSFGSTFASASQVDIEAPDIRSAMRAQAAVDELLSSAKGAGEIAGYRSPSFELSYPDRVRKLAPRLVFLRDRVSEARPAFLASLAELRYRVGPDSTAYYDGLEEVLASPLVQRYGGERVDSVALLARRGERVRLQTRVWPVASEDGRPAVAIRSGLRERLQSLPMPPDVTLQVTGILEMFQRANDQIYRDLKRVSAVGVGCVAAALFLFFRSLPIVLLILLPLAAVFPLTLAAVVGAGVRVTPASLSFVAIVVGVGIDDAVHVVVRFLQGLPAATVLREIGPILTLTTLSTMIGFGSLAISRHQVVASFGVIVAIGVASCWLFTILLLGPLLRLLRKTGPRRHADDPAVAEPVTTKTRRAGGALVPLLVALSFMSSSVAATPPAGPGSQEPGVQAGADDGLSQRVLDRIRKGYEGTEAFSYSYVQTLEYAQFTGVLRVEGSILFQKPRYLKAELRGDQNVDVLCDGDVVWVIDHDLGEVETIELHAGRLDGRLSWLLPPLVLASPEELEASFTVRYAGRSDGLDRIELVPVPAADGAFSRLLLDVDGRGRPIRSVVHHDNGDRVETRFDDWRRLGAVSPLVFTYRGGGEGPGGTSR